MIHVKTERSMANPMVVSELPGSVSLHDNRFQIKAMKACVVVQVPILLLWRLLWKQLSQFAPDGLHELLLVHLLPLGPHQGMGLPFLMGSRPPDLLTVPGVNLVVLRRPE